MNIKKILSDFCGAILGVLITIYGIMFFGEGATGAQIAVGVLITIVGILYLCSYFITLFDKNRSSVLNEIGRIYKLLGLPIFYVLFTSFSIYERKELLNVLLQYIKIPAANLIVFIILFASIAFIIFGAIFAEIKKDALGKKIRFISLLCFNVATIVSLVFSVGQLNEIGSITLFQIICLGTYFVYAFGVVIDDARSAPVEVKLNGPKEEKPEAINPEDYAE